jgi:hypothetical protein
MMIASRAIARRWFSNSPPQVMNALAGSLTVSATRRYASATKPARSRPRGSHPGRPSDDRSDGVKGLVTLERVQILVYRTGEADEREDA